MNKISLEQVNSVKYVMRDALGEDAKWIDTEIQDDGDFLLVLVETSLTHSSELTDKMVKTAAAILEDQIVLRQGEIAWMVNICHLGALLESEAGGQMQD